MRGRSKRREPNGLKDERADMEAGLSPLPGEPAAGLAETHTPVPGFTVQGVGGGRKGRTSCSTVLFWTQLVLAAMFSGIATLTSKWQQCARVL